MRWIILAGEERSAADRQLDRLFREWVSGELGGTSALRDSFLGGDGGLILTQTRCIVRMPPDGGGDGCEEGRLFQGELRRAQPHGRRFELHSRGQRGKRMRGPAAFRDERPDRHLRPLRKGHRDHNQLYTRHRNACPSAERHLLLRQADTAVRAAGKARRGKRPLRADEPFRLKAASGLKAPERPSVKNGRSGACYIMKVR